ncbi:sodium:alanine symporter family protein [Candidatus Babeliales bacterium]|nr:sodium:alanine symporter family protein [Candidatus Babeliales bacterium]MBP9843396.1 sodium:alanine symporter family protein [Candidatus Babeliales bacterium]
MVDFTTLLGSMHHIDTIMSAIFLIIGIFLSFFIGFPQLRNGRRFLQIISSAKMNESTKNTISPLQALLAAMSTSLGSGSIAGVPLAIVIGGPGALFWIVVYAFFGSVTKFTEVAFAIKYRTRAEDRSIIGGPTSYLWQVHPFLAHWYGACALVLFAGWSGLQAQALSEVFYRLGVSEYITGSVTALFVFYMLIGGAKRIGKLSSYLVPVMCTSYLVACLFILLQDIPLLGRMFILVLSKAFTPTAATGGFLGSTVLMAMRQGVFKSAYVTEAGIGTAAFPHALADTESATDQGTLAMYSVAIDAFFCLISGFVVLVTGVWTSGAACNTLIYDAFNIGLPTIGPAILIFSLTLFVTGTAVGNSFNGSKSFGFFTGNKHLIYYYIFVAIMMFLGSITQTLTLWKIIDFIMPLTALPNLIGIIYLSIKHRKELLS